MFFNETDSYSTPTYDISRLLLSDFSTWATLRLSGTGYDGFSVRGLSLDSTYLWALGGAQATVVRVKLSDFSTQVGLATGLRDLTSIRYLNCSIKTPPNYPANSSWLAASFGEEGGLGDNVFCPKSRLFATKSRTSCETILVLGRVNSNPKSQ